MNRNPAAAGDVIDLEAATTGAANSEQSTTTQQVVLVSPTLASNIPLMQAYMMLVADGS